MMHPLTCKVPDCGITRDSSSPDFCWKHERIARAVAGEACEEADHLTELAARFVRWCRDNGQPNPYE
jgi:hypothetical protein